MSIFGGLITSVIGIGGGIIFGPLMLEFGLDPEIAASTSMYLEMYLTFDNTVIFTYLGYIYPWHQIIMGVCVVLGSLVGLLLVA